jgi:hypothetical protein
LCNTVGIWILNYQNLDSSENWTNHCLAFKWFGIQMSNSSPNHLNTEHWKVPIILLPNTGKVAIIWMLNTLFSFHMIGTILVFGIQITFKIQTIWQVNNFGPFEYWTCLVFRFPLYFSELFKNSNFPNKWVFNLFLNKPVFPNLFCSEDPLLII